MQHGAVALLAELCCNVYVQLDAEALCVRNARADFRDTLETVGALNEAMSTCCYFDIGGTPFHTTADTAQRDPGSMLAALTSGCFPAEAGDDGYVFLDRDPEYFALVLQRLRQSDPPTPPGPQAFHALQQELRYYSLRPLPDKLVMATGLVDDTGGSVIALHHPRSNQWEFHPCEELKGLSHWACSVHRRGPSSQIPIRCFDPRRKQWQVALDITELLPPPEYEIRNLEVFNGQFVLCAYDRINDFQKWLVVDHQSSKEVPHALVSPRCWTQSFVAAGVLFAAAAQEMLYTRSVREGWRRLPPLRTPRTCFAVAAYQGDVVIIGGDTADGRLSAEVSRLDLTTMRWTPLPPLTIPRRSALAFEHDGRLHVVGGEASELVFPGDILTEEGEDEEEEKT
eukprot:EG_transcript_15293